MTLDTPSKSDDGYESPLSSVEHLYRGGYADIYLDNNTCQVIKNQKLVKYKCFDYSTFNEIVFMNALQGIPGIPIFYKAILSPNALSEYVMHDVAVDIHMPFYGQSLHNWKKTTPLENIQRNLPIVLCELTRTLHLMHQLGLQHMDIKPNNVLMQNGRPILIDFNLCSIRTTSLSCNKWNSSISTWAYAAPEVILYEQPSDTSMVWSLGVLMAYLVDDHPLQFLATNMKWDSQNSWQKIMLNAQTSHDGDVHSLTMSHTLRNRLPPSLHDAYAGCMRWDPKQRWSIAKVYSVLRDMCYDTTSSISTLKIAREHAFIMRPFARRGSDMRYAMLQKMWQWCAKHQLLDILSRSIGILDRTEAHVEPDVALCIAYLLSGKYIDWMENTAFQELPKLFRGIKASDLCRGTFVVSIDLDWNMYEVPADVILEDKMKGAEFDVSKMQIHMTVFKAQRDWVEGTYTMHDIADQAYKEFASNMC